MQHDTPHENIVPSLTSHAQTALARVADTVGCHDACLSLVGLLTHHDASSTCVDTHNMIHSDAW
jgi:hypothetical protein